MKNPGKANLLQQRRKQNILIHSGYSYPSKIGYLCHRMITQGIEYNANACLMEFVIFLAWTTRTSYTWKFGGPRIKQQLSLKDYRARKNHIPSGTTPLNFPKRMRLRRPNFPGTSFQYLGPRAICNYSLCTRVAEGQKLLAKLISWRNEMN